MFWLGSVEFSDSDSTCVGHMSTNTRSFGLVLVVIVSLSSHLPIVPLVVPCFLDFVKQSAFKVSGVNPTSFFLPQNVRTDIITNMTPFAVALVTVDN